MSDASAEETVERANKRLEDEAALALALFAERHNVTMKDARETWDSDLWRENTVLADDARHGLRGPEAAPRAKRQRTGASGVAICPGADHERGFHHRFAGDRAHGEWFKATPRLLAYVELARKNYGLPEWAQSIPPTPREVQP